MKSEDSGKVSEKKRGQRDERRMERKKDDKEGGTVGSRKGGRH